MLQVVKNIIFFMQISNRILLGTYNKLQQKRITVLADICNSAAHGKQDEFSAQDVEDMIRDVERFVAEHL